MAPSTFSGRDHKIDCPDPRHRVEDARHAAHGLATKGVDCRRVAIGAQDRAVPDRIFGLRGHIAVPRVEAPPERRPALHLRLTR